MLDYGIIGNCVTGALVKKNASVDWMCFPTFSSPSVFAKIIDEKKGGSLSIRPVGAYAITQHYIPRTAVLETRFESPESAFAVLDFFPRYKKLLNKSHQKLARRSSLIRIIRPLKGKPRLSVRYEPRPGYAAGDVAFSQKDGNLVARSGDEYITLSSNIPPEHIFHTTPFTLDTAKYMVVGNGSINEEHFSVKRCNKMLTATKKYWEKWCSTLIIPTENSDVIVRSAITLKLLTYSPTGAIMAAATTSIPEEVGTPRTWDYRFCWMRDAAFCVDVFKKMGRDYESKSLMEFILKRALADDYIQPMYGIGGETRLREQILSHLAGFKGSGNVRVGNAAYNQNQHDIYGEIIDIIYLYFVYYEYESRMTKKYWRFLRYIVNQIKFNWEKKDSSIWEFRGMENHYTYSKFMCYVGMDRAIKIAQHFGKEELINEWLDLRDEIKADILKNGYNQNAKAFSMFYGSTMLDASLLQMAYYEFLDAADPRIINTVRAVYNKLRKGYLVQRYDGEDDFGRSTSAFTICSFWLIGALHYIGEKEKAASLYKKILTKANHLGLFSEDIGLVSKKLLGNFPQAYTHIALINTSILLSEWSSTRKKLNLPHRRKWF